MRKQVKAISLFARTACSILFPALLLAGCAGKPPQAAFERPPAPVSVATAVAVDVPIYLDEVGRGVAREFVSVQPQVSGRITEQHFADGADLKQGDLLFTIDPRPYEAALNQMTADLNRDKAQSIQLQNDFTRYETLLKEGVGSRQQYDEARSKYEAIAATVAADEANVQTARLNLEYTRILSPIDGRTGTLILHQGNVVKANADTDMVVINQIKPVYVNFALPEQSLATVRTNMAVHPLSVDVIAPGDKADVLGRLSFVDNTVDATTGTISLKGLFDNQDQKLWPGQFVDTYLTLSERPDAVLVPSQAVQTGQDGSYVFLIDRKMKATIRKVAVGETIEGNTIIENGLGGGETIVTDGQLRLMPGATVMIKNADQATARAAS
jgi:multidrug efflux system membrane fusion protein